MHIGEGTLVCFWLERLNLISLSNPTCIRTWVASHPGNLFWMIQQLLGLAIGNLCRLYRLYVYIIYVDIPFNICIEIYNINNVYTIFRSILGYLNWKQNWFLSKTRKILCDFKLLQGRLHTHYICTIYKTCKKTSIYIIVELFLNSLLRYLLNFLSALLHTICKFADLFLWFCGVCFGMGFPCHGCPLLLACLVIALLWGIHLLGRPTPFTWLSKNLLLDLNQNLNQKGIALTHVL